jgi:hypothetical protein
MSGGQATFRYVNTKTGETIATGPLSLLNDQLAAQRTAEGAIRAAALVADQSHRARADALDRRERAIQAREDATTKADLCKLADGIARIRARMDAYEKHRADASLAEEIRQADAALAALSDHGDLEIKEAPELRDAEEVEARGGNSDVESAIEADADDLDGGAPVAPNPPSSYTTMPSEPLGALNDAADLRDYGRTFMRRADRRAYIRSLGR